MVIEGKVVVEREMRKMLYGGCEKMNKEAVVEEKEVVKSGEGCVSESGRCEGGRRRFGGDGGR